MNNRPEVLSWRSAGREAGQPGAPEAGESERDEALDAMPMAEPNRWLMNLNLSYEDMLRSAVDWIWECNAQLTLTYVSRANGSGTRLPSALLVGRSLQELDPNVTGKEADEPAFSDQLEARQAFRDVRLSFQESDQEAGGQPGDVKLTGVPFYDRRNGRFLGYRGTGTAVAHDSEAGSGPDHQIVALLESALARKDQLEWEMSKAGHKTFEGRLAAIAHELRTPLNAIVGFSEIIKTRALGNELDRYVEYGSDIHESGVHMVALVNKLIDLARINPHGEDADDDSHAPEPIDVHDVVAGAVRMLEDQSSDAAVRLINHLPRELPTLAGDKQALRQILINLLSNAIKYTRPGGAVGVEADSDPAEGTLSIEVWDTGVGIPAEEQERIFERNYRIADEANVDKAGSGLGLAISRDLARSMGGDISVESKYGQGARFTVTLPLPNDEEEAQ